MSFQKQIINADTPKKMIKKTESVDSPIFQKDKMLERNINYIN